MVLAVTTAAVAQDRALRNPRDGDSAAVRTGAGFFRERCAEGHGADAKGVAGHDLTKLWSSGVADAQVFQTIRAGVPNTLMSSSSAPDDEVWALVSYLRSLNGAASTDTAGENTQTGERIFESACRGCHAVNGRGGPLGPDLSLIGQSSRESLTRAIREPTASIAAANSGTGQRDAEHSYGVLRAIDPTTVERKWEFKYPTPTMAGVMSTASGVVFAGDNEGNFMAFEARTGKNLWFYPTGSPIWGATAMTYTVDGRQQVLIGSGTTVTAFALPNTEAPNGSR